MPTALYNRKMNKGQKESMVVRCLAKFDEPRRDFSVERVEVEEDGYRFYVRRAYVKGVLPISSSDVEYHIQARRKGNTTTEWSCFVYMNQLTYLNAGLYPSIPGTTFGVEWL
jgi:hypothetical protein